jgi:hypothetical protein
MVSATLCDWLARCDGEGAAALEDAGVDGLLRSDLILLLTGLAFGALGAAETADDDDVVAARVEVSSISLSVEYSDWLPSSGSERALPEREAADAARRTGL